MNNQYIYSYNNQYNISIHTKNIEILTNSIKLLQDSNIHVDSFASVVNGIADFVQKNNYYTIFNSFFNIADYLVDIIERFQANDEYVRENKEALVIAMSKLKNEIIKKSHINLFFCGYDNNNILDKMNNIKNIFNVKTIDEAINRVKCSNKSSLDINILMIDKKIYMINKEYYKKYFSDLIYYDNLVDYLMDIGEQLYFSNYDYNYLINSMEKANIEPIDTIIVGNSYPLTGIDVRLLDYKCVSLALSSQDLYYSYKLAKSVIESNKHIKRCIIGSGYYLINHDLSKSKNLDAINRVRNVYYPIFKDAHNSQYIQKTEIRQIKNVSDDYIIDYIFNLDTLDKYLKHLVYKDNDGYFNKKISRKKSIFIQGTQVKVINEEDKYKLGKERANQHNKLSKYDKTSEEYKQILNEFIAYLKLEGIEAIIIVFPTTKYYSENLDEKFKREFYEILDKIDDKHVKILDFSEMNNLNDDDFTDMDHMSEIGAKKITIEVNRRI